MTKATKIKKGLECCGDANCERCPYKNTEWHGQILSCEALEYIEQLENELKSIKEALNDSNS